MITYDAAVARMRQMGLGDVREADPKAGARSRLATLRWEGPHDALATTLGLLGELAVEIGPSAWGSYYVYNDTASALLLVRCDLATDEIAAREATP